MSYIALTSKAYPPSPLDNDRCHFCWYYSSKTDTCDYYLKTGKRKTRPVAECNVRIPRHLVREKKTHPWYYASGIFTDEKIKAAPQRKGSGRNYIPPQ